MAEIGDQDIDKLAVGGRLLQLDPGHAVKSGMVASIPHRGDQRADRVLHGGRADLEIPGRFRVGAFGDPEILVRLLQDRVHDIDGVMEADQPPGGADAAKQPRDLLRRNAGHFVFRMKAVHICPPLSDDMDSF